nr:zinc finger BED domain-containing protein DAYSLEEPER [Tanacetum cinerariifolium]
MRSKRQIRISAQPPTKDENMKKSRPLIPFDTISYMPSERSGSYTTLRNHITHPHCEVIKAQKNQNLKAGQTSMARDESVFRYDPDYLCEQFAGLVIQRGLPFNHFDHEQTTRVFQNTMQPRYTHVSRSTLKRDAMRLWLAAKQEIIDSFGNLNACVNLTTNVWSPPHGVPGSYMCVTAHWIEPGTWQMIKRVISFEEFLSPHTGHALFKMLIKVLTNFNMKDKVMSITLDNTSNNTSAMDKLKLKYDPPIEAIPLSDEEITLDASNEDTLSPGGPRIKWEESYLFNNWNPRHSKFCKIVVLHTSLDVEEDIFDDEVQRNEAIPLSDEEITLDASNEDTLSPGGPRTRGLGYHRWAGRSTVLRMATTSAAPV